MVDDVLPYCRDHEFIANDRATRLHGRVDLCGRICTKRRRVYDVHLA